MVKISAKDGHYNNIIIDMQDSIEDLLFTNCYFTNCTIKNVPSEWQKIFQGCIFENTYLERKG